MHTEMKQRALLAISCTMLLVCCGCENNFSPKGEYQKQLVVYGVLSNRSDSQYVRLYTTYNVSGFNPAEHTADTGVRGARVTMTDDSTIYTFKETAIPRDDTSRYASNLPVYVCFPCTARLGKSYVLSVASVEGSATATAVVPTDGYIDFRYPDILKNPGGHTEDIIVSIALSSLAQGYIVRFYLDVNVYINQSMVHKRSEVPSALISPVQWGYPQLKRRTTLVSQPYSYVIFSRAAYEAFRQTLNDQYGGFTLTGATFILTQVESNLYRYFNIVNGFQDPYSIRMDQPDYTNIAGGAGVFGSMVEDSVTVDLR